MEADRLVQVEVRRKPGPNTVNSVGSGYLVAPRLVLTAGHLVGDTEPWDAKVNVRHTEFGQTGLRCVVRWFVHNLDGLDAALLEITDPSWRPPASLKEITALAPQRWGFLATSDSGCPVSALGYPRMQREDNRRLVEQLGQGTVEPLTGSQARRYEISSTSAVPTGPAEDPHWTSPASSRWSGMSGAALFHRDLLIGIVNKDRRSDKGTRLTATRVLDLRDDPGFTAVITAHTGWPLILEPVELVDLVTSILPARDLRSPAMLLRADAEIVDFYGREETRELLGMWCDAGEERLSIRVLTGPGGQGKTRLARWLLDRQYRRGWIVGQLRADIMDAPDSDVPSTTLSLLGRVNGPALFVVDYAEARPDRVRRLIEHTRTAHRKIRILLVARAAGPWKTNSRTATATANEILQVAPEIKLEPLDRSEEARRTAFRAASKALARALTRVPGYEAIDWLAAARDIEPPEGFGGPRFDAALAVHMAALVEVLETGPETVRTEARATPEAVLLGHEERYWQRSGDAPMYALGGLSPLVRSRAVTAAILCGATSEGEARNTVARITDIPSDKRLDVAHWLRDLYPPPDGLFWGLLQPDRLAEHHAARTVLDADQLLDDLLDGAAQYQQSQAVIVLSRAAVAHANAGRLPTGQALQQLLDETLERLRPSTAVLRSGVDALPQSSGVLAGLAGRLTANLAAVYRELVNAGSRQHEPDLAWALSNLAVRYTQEGHVDEAISAGENAVAIRKRLTADQPGRYDADLAFSLSNVSGLYRIAGRHGEALEASREAARIRTVLAQNAPEAYGPELARTLISLSTHYADVDQHEEAQQAADEAVERCRDLVRGDSETYEADLALALHALSFRLWESSQFEQALTALQESATLYHAAAERAPDAYTGEYARILKNLGVRLRQTGDFVGATAAHHRAVELLNAYSPSGNGQLTNLASAWAGLENVFQRVGDADAALDAGRRTVDLYREAVDTGNADAEPSFLRALIRLARRYQDTGSLDQAVVTVTEAIDICRNLRRHPTETRGFLLGTALVTLYGLHRELGDQENALKAIKEAVAVRTKLSGHGQGDRHQQDLIKALTLLERQYRRMEQTADAHKTHTIILLLNSEVNPEGGR